jgi:CubicO group peptidase (beta-lactamase class C family)
MADSSLTLKAEARLRAEAGDKVDLLKGLTAEDACGNNLISDVKIRTTADLTKPGTYTVFYFLQDALGNKAILKRLIDIFKPETLFLYNKEKAEAIISASAERYHTMGMSVAVIENGRVIDTLVHGDAVYNIRQMTEDTKVRIASISKIGVAMAAARLFDDGLINPDEDISVYWDALIRNPHFPDTPVTIRDIMGTTSSLTNDDSDYRLDIKHTLSQLVSGDVFSRGKPGVPDSFMYNNYAFGILADTLELSCNEVLDDFIRKNIFEPMDIEASYSTITLKNEELAELYDAGWNVTRSVEHISTRPVRTNLGGYMWYYAGNLTISAGDLAKLVTVLINDGMYENTRLADTRLANKRILSSEVVAWLEEPQFTAEDEVPLEFTQCQPLRRRSGMYGRESLYYHTGQAYSACTFMCYDPDSGDGLVVLTTVLIRGLTTTASRVYAAISPTLF